MHISKRFIKSSVVYTVAGMLPMGSAVILLPFYIAFLSTSDFGALSIYFAFSLLIQIITTFSFDTSLYIHYHELKNDRPRLNTFVSSAFFLMIFIGSAVGLIFVFVGDFVFTKIFEGKTISFHPYGLIAAFTGVFQSLFKVKGNLLQSREKPDVFFWANVISFGLVVVFTIAGLKVFPNTLVGPVGGRMLAAVLSGSWAFWRILREFGVHFNYPLLRSTFHFNFYTYFYQILQWVINYFDRVILVFYLTLSDIGVYDFAFKCLLIIEFILNGLHNTFYPKVVSTVMGQKQKGSSPETNRYYHGFIAVLMILICFCILTFPWVIETFVSKRSYHEAIPILPYLAVIYIFRAIRLYFASPYGIIKYTKPLPIIYGIVSAVKIGLTILLITRFGLYGAVASSITAAILEIILLRFNLGERFVFTYNRFKILVAPIGLFLLIVGLEPFYGIQFGFLLHLFYVIACVVMLWWAYRNELKLLDPLKIIR
ncbi:MAG TPA: oligosaccharide flippase family protein [Chryseosolibacter sp.]